MTDENVNASDGDSMNSNDEALCEILGIPSLRVDFDEVSETEAPTARSLDELIRMPDMEMKNITDRHGLRKQYESQSYCIFPNELSVPSVVMRRLADELTWGGDKVKADKSYESIKVIKNGELIERRTLTRFENFVNHHDDWIKLSRDYVPRLISAALQIPFVLFKEKLNLKPPGGSGFAPHADGPSLRVALGADGPQTFLTVMVAIDDMSIQNGCLRIVKGKWNESCACPTVEPEEGGSPDAGGRAGAIRMNAADAMAFEDITVVAGSIVMFNSWVPHRSSANRSPFPRRAVFFTYNPAKEGDFHDHYYAKMTRLRDEWRFRAGAGLDIGTPDYVDELKALETVPTN
ncbi:hypothetical protein MPSEU_000703900 [Mayamaea pseudoterrestris]|nr:hypothetical protein MPSEU_000703900 [Mayamaea pseudoterrestris]